MSLILSLETSTPVCSAALHLDGNLLIHRELHEEQAHAAKLAVLVQEVFTVTERKMSELSAVAVCSGPGSYTGLRIGTSTAKGICYSLNIPLLSCTSLDVMINDVKANHADGAWMCPMLDARRMEVYCIVVDENLNTITPVEAHVLDENSFQNILNDRIVLFFGDGSDKCRDVIKHANARFIPGVYPKASSLGELASTKFNAGQIEDLTTFEPFYLKEFMVKKSSKLLF